MHFNCSIKGRGCEKEVERKKIRAHKQKSIRSNVRYPQEWNVGSMCFVFSVPEIMLVSVTTGSTSLKL